MKKLIITILFLSIVLPVQAIVLYNQDNIILQEINNGIFFTPPTGWDYSFSTELEDGMGTMALYEGVELADCWVIRHSNPYQASKCTINEASILFHVFPFHLIENLK